MRCPIPLLRLGVTMRLTRYAAASVVLPGLQPLPHPGTVSGSGLLPAPVPALGGPQGPPRSPPRPCTPPGSAGHRSGAARPGALPPRPPLPSPAGRLQKRLRAARRCWRVSGLESLLWPFRQRFSLAAAPDRSLPLRAMLDPVPRAAAPSAPFPLPAPAAILSEGSRQGRPHPGPAGEKRGRGTSAGSCPIGAEMGDPKGPGAATSKSPPDIPVPKPRPCGTVQTEPIATRYVLLRIVTSL